ncbi:unnamed protein product [Bemisia tabaci]|uniref:Ionotropic receptor n=1 Tax=Bemisia tabaci TaxID=7038 RepID=A0A9P0C2J0_BEMTA|nr:unnamed protein product [Bemisia tabaci]
MSSKLYLFGFPLMIYISLSFAALQISHSKRRAHLSTSALTVCKKTAEISGQDLIYVVSISSEFPVPTFIQRLHENWIETVSITHQHCLKRTITGSQTKNIIIFLKHLDEISSFILGSTSESTFVKSDDATLKKTSRLKNYCLKNDFHDSDLMDVNRTCDLELRISQPEMDGQALLTDPVCKRTKALFANSVWNSENYVTFMLEHGDHSAIKITARRLRFLFHFFWRFFRGLRTVVCRESICFKRDPFSDVIQQIDVDEDDYFDFAPVVGGNVRIGFVSKKDVFGTDEDVSPESTAIVYVVASDIQSDLQFEEVNVLGQARGESDYFGNAVAQNFDMLIFDGTFSPNADFSMFEFSAAIQSFSYCYATPRSNFIPLSFLPFKCFPPETWMAIVVVVVALLLLGRISTGKILFLLVSLFVLIVITTFQSELTTLLSKQVRYPEIDTLEELKNSDLLIQTPDLEASLELLKDYPFHAEIKRKLTEGHYYFLQVVAEYAGENKLNFLDYFGNLTHKPQIVGLNQLETNFRSIIESSAFELAVSNLRYKYQGNIQVEDIGLTGIRGEFHLAKECVLTYPMTLQVQKSSYPSDFFIRKISTYVEMGLTQKLIDDCISCRGKSSNPVFIDDVTDEDNSPASAFTVSNLQPAFISLIIGWILSIIVFFFFGTHG